ncbi:MAG TPA: SPOR domain-containing protein [Candidatus Binatia bacterium]
MAENRRGKDHRFYFSRGQMALLGASFTFASLIIFVLGVFVGQGIESRKLVKKEEPLVKIPVKPGAQESSPAPAPQVKNEITFNESLSKPGSAVAAAEEKPRAAKPADKIARVETQEAARSARAGAPAPAQASEKKVEKVAPAQDTAKKTEPPAKAEARDQGQTWRAQVNAFPDERSAKLIVDRLKDKGYNAYVTAVENRGKIWYRVSVGKYGSRDEADKMVELLRSKENYPKAFAATR